MATRVLYQRVRPRRAELGFSARRVRRCGRDGRVRHVQRRNGTERRRLGEYEGDHTCTNAASLMHMRHAVRLVCSLKEARRFPYSFDKVRESRRGCTPVRHHAAKPDSLSPSTLDRPGI